MGARGSTRRPYHALYSAFITLRASNVRTLSIVALGVGLVASRALATPGSPTCPIMGPADHVSQRASPLDSAVVDVGGGTVKVCYGRPSVRGRKIMGGLVPFSVPWRLGANEATTIYLPFAAEIGNVHVDAGLYSLYAVPGDSAWQIVVNRNATRWGIPIDAAVRTQDLGVDTVATEKIDGAAVETLTLRFEPPKSDATVLVVEWERTRVRIPVRRASS